MSLYRDLNNIDKNLENIKEIPLSETEKKRVLKKARFQIRPKQRLNKRWGFGLAAVAVCLISLALTIEKGTIASIPFTGEPIEKYINNIDQLDYSAYKTEIAESAENNLGLLTLNEVMMDDKRLFLSATFEPAEGVDFDYQTYIQPTVKINGQDYTAFTGGQSIEMNSSMFTIYNDITLTEAIKTENLSIEISYDTWNFDETRETIEQPWIFSADVSQKNLLVAVTEFEMNKEVTLLNGDKVRIEKVVATPISTSVYYDLSGAHSESIYFDIEAENGGVAAGRFMSSTSNTAGEMSFTQFEALDFDADKYYLKARNGEDEVLSELVPIN